MGKTPIKFSIFNFQFSILKKIKKWVCKHPLEATFLIAILLIGAILRLYKIADYMTFLGDEGRDVIVVRRFLVDFDLMLVGPGTSIGNMYLGPIYYYLMAPALLLAGFDPVGPAVMIALLGVGTIYFVWHVSREWFGKVAALVSAILYATAPVVIVYSRSSWNPNIMPFFALLVIYSIWKFWHERKYQWLIATAASFAFVLQSHYLGLLLGPVIGFFWLLSYFKAKGSKNTKYLIRYTAYAAVLFALFMSPLVIFDARHNWMNFSAMKEFFLQRQTTVSARPWTAIPKLPEIVNEASSRIASGTDGAIGKYISLTLLLGLVVSLFKIKEIKKLVRFKINDKRFAAYFLIAIWLTFAFIGLGVYKQEIYDHYYGFIFAAPFILIGAFSQVFIEKHKASALIIVGLVMTLLLQANFKNSPLKYHPNKQLSRTKKVVRKVGQLSDGVPFNFAVLAERNYEGAYMYFFERWDIPAKIAIADLLDETLADQLFVVCELPREKCSVEASDRPEITNFGWLQKVADWGHEGVIIYKYIHPE